ncbi:MAG: hypothetical protein IAF02_12600 [Anaerolineae bacterium]|nr:hypothetical protein [Anaerolineae bacterium]
MSISRKITAVYEQINTVSIGKTKQKNCKSDGTMRHISQICLMPHITVILLMVQSLALINLPISSLF